MAHGLLRWLGHQHYLRFGVRDRILRSQVPPDSCAPFPFEVEFFGAKYPGSLDSYLDWSVYFYGAYERAEVLFLRELVSQMDSPIVLDIGANIGHHTLALAGLSAHVHAFEPFPALAAKIQQKLDRNKIANVSIHRFGLSDTEAELPYFASVGANKGTGSFVDGYSTNNAPAGTLTVSRGDRVVDLLKLDRIDLIKIDVEGFEKNVLAGLQKSLERFRPAIFMEYSPETAASFGNEAGLRSLLPAGYAISKVVSDSPRLVVFNKHRVELKPFDFATPGGNLMLTPN